MHLKSPAHYFWLFSICYGRLFGRAWLAPLHHAFLNISLHALGYDNCYGSNSGEEWFVNSVLRKHDIRVSLDVGANIGNYSNTLLTHLDTTVYAIEPSSSSFSELRTRTAPFSKRILYVQKAVSDFVGEATLFSSDPLSETATLEKGLTAAGANQETVPVTTIDTLVQEFGIARIDFIKIDTEGFEREVMRGMQQTLNTHAPMFIQFEFNHLQLFRGYTVYDLTQLLPGYEFFRLLPRGLVPLIPSAAKDNVFMYCNIIAKRIL